MKKLSEKILIIVFIITTVIFFSPKEASAITIWLYDSSTATNHASAITCGGTFYVNASSDYNTSNYPGYHDSLFCLNGLIPAGSYNIMCSESQYNTNLQRGPYTAPTGVPIGTYNLGTYFDQNYYYAANNWPTYIQLYGNNYNTTCYIPGACGPAGSTAGISYAAGSSSYAGAYCNAGTASASPAFPNASSYPTPYATSWQCIGNGGGATVTCIAKLKVNGVCGTAGTVAGVNYAQGATFPNGSYCSTTGSPTWISSPSQTLGSGAGSTASWTCPGINSGSASGTCLATRLAPVINGACNASVSSYYQTSPPVTTDASLCTTGSPNNITGSGSWTYSCQGSGTGHTDANNCTAPLRVDGVCGLAARSYSSSESSYTQYLCNAGSMITTPSSPAFPTVGSPKTWTCGGVASGLASPTCTAVLVPTLTNSRTYLATETAYFGNLCSTSWGNSPAPITWLNPGETKTWTCVGSGGSNSPTCTANRLAAATCGAETFNSNSCSFSGSFCALGIPVATATSTTAITPTLPQNPGDSTTWYCYNNGVHSSACIATHPAGTQGDCGTASTTYSLSTTSFPAGATFCNYGTPVDETGAPVNPGFPLGGSNPYTTWYCKSLDCGLVSDQCAARLGIATDNCGPAGALESAGGTNYIQGAAFPGGNNYCNDGSNPTSWISPATSGSHNLGSAGNSTVRWTCKNGSGNCMAIRLFAPTVTLNSPVPKYCDDLYINSGSIDLTWTFSSPSGLGYSNFDYQISERSDFATITKFGSVSEAEANLPISDPSDLKFGKTYYWRVKPYDTAGGHPGDYISASTPFTTPAHAYPHAVITVFPTSSPVIKTSVQLQADGSGCYGTPNSCTYLWAANLDREYFGAVPDATNIQRKDPIAHAYPTTGQRNERLKVCDPALAINGVADSGCCSTTTSFTVKTSSNVPQWKEVSPFN